MAELAMDDPRVAGVEPCFLLCAMKLREGRPAPRPMAAYAIPTWRGSAPGPDATTPSGLRPREPNENIGHARRVGSG